MVADHSRSGACRAPLPELAIAVIASLIVAAPATAAEAAPPFPVAGRLSHAIQKYCGLNSLTNLCLSTGAKIALKLALHGKVKARVQTYNFTDLLSGKVKTIDLDLKGGSYRGVPLGRVHVVSAMPVWIRYLPGRGKKPGVEAPTLLHVRGEVSSREVARGLASPRVSSALRMLKLDVPGLGQQQLELLCPQVSLGSGVVKIKSTMVTAGAAPDTGVPVELSGKPVLVGNSRIFVNDLQVNSPEIPNPQEFAVFVSKLLNPLVDLSRFDRKDHAFRLAGFQVLDDRVEFDGNLLLAPRVASRIAQKAGN